MGKRDNIRRAIERARDGRGCKLWGHDWRPAEGLAAVIGRYSCARCSEYSDDGRTVKAAAQAGEISRERMPWWRNQVDPLDEMMGPTARAREQAEAAAKRSAIERGRVAFLDAGDDILPGRISEGADGRPVKTYPLSVLEGLGGGDA